jgi:transposase InsO family protein/transposase-like protein
MRYTPAEKLEIIRLVDGSDIGVTRTLKQLGIHKSTFYNWYEKYEKDGPDGLKDRMPLAKRTWNRIPQAERERVVEIALEKEALSARELAWHITDHHDYFISESSVYRILREYGLITAPAHIVLSASDEFKDKTSHPNQMWQTDFTYFKIIGWGWYYLSTVLDDYSRYIVAWELCKGMKAEDAESTVRKALSHANLPKHNRPKLLSDNGSSYIADDFNRFLKDENIIPVHGRPLHPQTQGKIERYNRSLKNIIKLENYYSTEELERAVEKFVHHYNHHRYHESISNCTPAQVYYNKAAQVLEKRKRTKARTLKRRKQLHRKSVVKRE